MNIKPKLLLLFTLLAILPIVIVGALSYHNAKEALVQQQIDSLEAVVDSRISDITHVVQLRVEQARQIGGTYLPRQLRPDGVHDPFVIQRLQEHIELIYEHVKKNYQTDQEEGVMNLESSIERIEVWDANGTIVSSTGAARVGDQIPDSAFQRVREGGIHFSEDHPNSLNGNQNLLIVEEIRNLESGEFAGVVALTITGNILNEISLYRAGLGNTGEVLLFAIDSDRLEFITKLRHADQPPEIVMGSQLALPVQQVARGINGKGISTDYRGVEVGAVWKKIPGLNWGIVGKVDTAEIFIPVNELGKKILIFGFGLLGFSIFLAWYCARTISDPIQQLVDVFSRISRGELGDPVKIQREDELGVLARRANESIRYLRNVIRHANSLGEGNYDRRIEPKGDEDELGIALEKMTENLIANQIEIQSLLDKSEEQKNQLQVRQREIEQANKELVESQSRIQAILEASVDGIITIDERGRILSFNQAARKMFGYEEHEVINRNVSMLMPVPYSEQHDSYLQNYLETGEKKIIGIGREVQGLRKDGSIFPIDLAVSDVKWEGNRIFSGIIKDISTRKELERRVLHIGDEERRKIGQDLHDGLGQMLTGIRMVSENLARKLLANGVPGASEVQEIADMVQEADEYARTLSHGMAQVDLEKNGLGLALENLSNRVEKMFGIQCEYIENGNIDDVTDKHSIALNLYRIVQESINNAVKHGDADKINCRLSNSSRHLSLVVEDNGKGFNPEIKNHQGMGIEIMKYRAGILGGILEITRTEEEKTQVRCIIPHEKTQL
ncbi:MAG: PAS domain S-box protein [Balneolaceae bacterium]